MSAVGENMKQLEISAEKAQQREEKLKEQIHALIIKLKTAEARYEYGEMNITKLNQRIDDIEDDIYREKLKIKKTDKVNACVVGVTVEDPFKDTSGPALNILIELMSMVSQLCVTAPWPPP